jgi:hypothetical protein
MNNMSHLLFKRSIRATPRKHRKRAILRRIRRKKRARNTLILHTWPQTAEKLAKTIQLKTENEEIARITLRVSSALMTSWVFPLVEEKAGDSSKIQRE